MRTLPHMIGAIGPNFFLKEIPMRMLHVAAASLLVLGISSGVVNADALISITEQNQSVVVSSSGSLNIDGLTPISTGTGNGGGINGATGYLFLGGLGQVNGYAITGPTSFGSLDDNFSTLSEGGRLFGISGEFQQLFMPWNYVSGEPLDSFGNYSNESISSMQLIPGTYVYSWGSGATADSLTVNIAGIPEPSSLFPLGVVCGLAYYRRRRSKHVAKLRKARSK